MKIFLVLVHFIFAFIPFVVITNVAPMLLFTLKHQEHIYYLHIITVNKNRPGFNANALSCF